VSITIRLHAPVVALALALSVAAAPQGVRAESLATEGGLGAGSAVASIVYGPLKLAYSVGGIVLGVMTFVWTRGDADLAGPLFTMAMDGDYVVTPEHLKGDEQLVFAAD
jgi:hypothetical protein